MTPTEALARLRTRDDDRLGLTDTERLTALLIDIDSAIEQAAEAADREAAGRAGVDSRSPDEGAARTSAAADLDVEALAAALHRHAVWHIEALPCNERCTADVIAAYAAAKEAK